MKKNLLKDSLHIYFSKALALFLIGTCASSLQAQVQNNGTVYVGQNSILYTSGVFTFGTGSITRTFRDANFGTITLGPSATASGAASGANLFVDGYVNTRSASYFELPTGQGTTYAPVGVTNAAVTNGVTAAYFQGALTSTVADATIQTLPTAGYWDVRGDNAVLTLKWNSTIASLTNSIANLTVAGFNTTTSSWQAIPSASATGSLTTGAIATSAAVNLASFSAITLAEKGITCAPLVASSGLTRTWNGSAWDTTPTLADAAVLAGPYPSTAGSFVCNSLNIGANAVTLVDGQTIEVVNAITGSGTITMSSAASVMQRNDASTITPNIVLTKSSRVNMRANDYIYWGSPLTTDSFSQLDGARAYSSSNVLTGTAAAFDLKYAYASGIMGTSGGWQALGATAKGKGFIMRIKDQAPYSAATPYSGYINLTFTGTANNGVVDVPTANVNATSTTSARNNNLLANPYPSAIDADKFLEYNTSLDGVIYLWRASTPNAATGTAYVVGDYVAYTRAGTTGISGINATFDGKIATGQGFKVKAIDTAPTGTATFNNCMRVSGNNTQFMKMNTSASTTNIDRFNVNITNADGTGNQVLVAYMPEASLAYDRMYDASLNTVSPLQMYSILDNDTKKLAINARPVFDVNDQVAVGFKKETTDAAILSINVAQKEGVFASTATPIYLHDTVLNVYHNFNNGAYSFATTETEDNSRFKIVYQAETLSNDEFSTAAVIANMKDNKVTLTANAPMVNVIIFDLTGKKLYESKIQNATIFFADFNHAQALYIAKVTLEDGSTANVKLINQK